MLFAKLSLWAVFYEVAGIHVMTPNQGWDGRRDAALRFQPPCGRCQALRRYKAQIMVYCLCAFQAVFCGLLAGMATMTGPRNLDTPSARNVPA